MVIRGALTAALILGSCLACDADPKKVAEPTTITTATPPPVPTPTARPCFEPSASTTTANQFTVELLIFSGRRNPTWRLTADQSREFKARLLRNTKAARGLEEMPGQLGYAGYIVNVAPSQHELLRKTGVARQFWVSGSSLEGFLSTTRPCSVFG